MRIVVPYSLEVLDSVIYEYQSTFFPLQLLFFSLGILAIYQLWQQKRWNNQLISAVLALFWCWSGFVYLGIYYEQINWFGFYMAILFCTQGILWLWYGVIKNALEFQRNRTSIALAFAYLVLLPALQLFSGVGFFNVYIVGILPLATLAFSVSILVSLDSKKILQLSVIPFVWIVFSLYWNYLLQNTIPSIILGLSLAVLVLAVYKSVRK